MKEKEYDFEVSIIIPIYNSEKTIEKCIKSVQAQTFRNLQIIVVDDGSTDNSKIKVKELKLEDKRISIFTKKNGGVSSARNLGIEMAEGESIFFLDSDDYIDEDLIESLLKMKKQNNIDLVCCNFKKNNEVINSEIQKDNIIALDKETVGDIIYEMYLGSACGKLFKASIIREYGIRFVEQMTLGEDMEFVHNYIQYINSAAKLNNKFYFIQDINPISLSKRYVTNMRQTLIIYQNTIEKVFKLYPQYKKKYEDNHLTLNIACCVRYINNLYLLDTPIKGLKRIKTIKRYLIEENNISVFFEKKSYSPKANIDKAYILIFRTKNCYIIGLFFLIKEFLKRKKIKI